MHYLLLAGLIVAFSAPLLHRLLGRHALPVLAVLPLLLLAHLGSWLPAILQGSVIVEHMPWVPALGVNLQLRLDGLSLFFALLIALFGLLIFIYAGTYLKAHPLLGRFYLYLTLFMTAMLGLVLSDNLFCFFAFWELTSISSYLLIGFSQEKEESRKSAWQALLVTSLGGLALLAGFLLLGSAAASDTFTDLLRQQALSRHPLYVPAVLLICLGCFTKSAQFPFHFWLPNAMVAPTPISAYLHAATMVKAGIYLLARLSPVLGDTQVWQLLLTSVGGLTALLGTVLALQQRDLKAILAYTTISALGLMVTMIGLGTEPAFKGLLVFLLAHALYKGTLFLVAGVLDHSTGIRQYDALRRLGPPLPLVATAAALAALSMAGFMPFFGFMGKEILYEAALGAGHYAGLIFGFTLLAGVAFAGIGMLLGYGLFWEKSTSPTPLQHKPSPGLTWPPFLLGCLGLAFGFVPALVAPLLEQAARNVAGHPDLELKLALWHGFTPVLAWSAFTLVLGYGLYRWLSPIQSHAARLQQRYRWGPAYLYQKGFTAFLSGAKAFTSFIQNGYLRSYTVTLLLAFCGLLCYTLWQHAPPLDLGARLDLLRQVQAYEVVVVLLVIAALIYLLGTRSRLTSIVVMGLVGYSAALFYILFGAPDVAATQLLIETLTVVIFVFLLHKLPAFVYLSHQFRKFKFIAVSVLFGTLMTYVLLLVQEHATTSELKQFYGHNSYAQAHGLNIVNVILVDFRALDTLGEITVLAVAALGIFALLEVKHEENDKP